MTTQTPLLSVCIITYNHEKFIKQAIDSVLMQQCDFPIEIIIGEDCSTDKTRIICNEYAQKYTSIKLLDNHTNLGMVDNFLRTSKACAGKYIAMLEGDDYWTDPNKLQKQVEFLESNPDFVLCFHNRTHQIGEVIYDELLYGFKTDLTFSGNRVFDVSIHTLTVVFRNILKENPYPKQFHSIPLYDYVIWPYLSLFGSCRYLNFTGATYRFHAKGFYSAAEDIAKHQMLLQCSEQMRGYFPKDYQISIGKNALMFNFLITEEYLKKSNFLFFGFYLLLLLYRSLLYNHYEYVKYYVSFFKTNFKKRIKNFLKIPLEAV